MTPKHNYLRHHIIVPEADTIVEEWIKKQDNISGSLRVLIKQFVNKYGVTDILCCPDLGAGMFEQQTPKSTSNDSEVEQNIQPKTSEEPAAKQSETLSHEEIVDKIVESLLE